MADIKFNEDTRTSKFYRAWAHMKSRCYNTNVFDYKRYGARGIKVCKKWQMFNGFMEDMLPTYKKNLTLDRIDNDGNYCKENCRWVDRVVQANNRRTNRIVIYKNIKKTMAEWARYLGIKSSTLRQRYYVYHWSISRCFSV